MSKITVWNFHDFPTTQILREIKVSEFSISGKQHMGGAIKEALEALASPTLKFV